MDEKHRYPISRPSRAVPRVERAPLCVNQTEAVKVIGSPKLLHDLETEGLIVPLNEGKPKWYSVVNLQRAVLEKVRSNQAARTNGNRGFFILPIPSRIFLQLDRFLDRLAPSLGKKRQPSLGLN